MNPLQKSASITLILLTLSSCKQFTPERMETRTDAVFSYLAMRRSMNVLRSGGEELGAFGTVYGLLKPATPSELYTMSKRGKPIDISPYDQSKIALISFTSETTRYQIQSQLASEIGATLKAEIEEAGGNINVFKQKLINSNIKFTVSRISTYERTTREGFSGHTYTREELPDDFTAVFTPLEILKITNFTYEEKTDDSLEGKLAAKFINGFEGDIRAKKVANQSDSIEIEHARVIAIRPLVLAKKDE